MITIIGILATYRLAQIIAQDTISEPFRYWLTRGNSALADLPFLRRWAALGITCVICVSVWAGVIVGLVLHGVSAQSVVYGLGYSGGAVVLGSWLANQNRSKHDNHL